MKQASKALCQCPPPASSHPGSKRQWKAYTRASCAEYILKTRMFQAYADHTARERNVPALWFAVVLLIQVVKKQSWAVGID
jgi:hypothetical protein